MIFIISYPWNANFVLCHPPVYQSLIEQIHKRLEAAYHQDNGFEVVSAITSVAFQYRGRM